MSPKDKNEDRQLHTHTHIERFSSSFNLLCYWEVAACLYELVRFEKALKLTKDPDPKARDKWMKRKETERGMKRMRRDRSKKVVGAKNWARKGEGRLQRTDGQKGRVGERSGLGMTVLEKRN